MKKTVSLETSDAAFFQKRRDSDIGREDFGELFVPAHSGVPAGPAAVRNGFIVGLVVSSAIRKFRISKDMSRFMRDQGGIVRTADDDLRNLQAFVDCLSTKNMVGVVPRQLTRIDVQRVVGQGTSQLTAKAIGLAKNRCEASRGRTLIVQEMNTVLVKEGVATSRRAVQALRVFRGWNEENRLNFLSLGGG